MLQWIINMDIQTGFGCEFMMASFFIENQCRKERFLRREHQHEHEQEKHDCQKPYLKYGQRHPGQVVDHNKFDLRSLKFWS